MMSKLPRSVAEKLWPNEYYRIKEKALSGALGALKNSRKKKDAEKERLKKEIERLRGIILSQAEEIDLLKKDQLGLLGSISGYRLSVHLKKELIDIVENSLLLAKRVCRVLRLNRKRFYRWRKNYIFFSIDGLVDEKPIAKVIPNKLLKEEEEVIFNYARLHPQQRDREIQYNLDQQGWLPFPFPAFIEG